MKSTKTILAVAIVIAGFASFGCGSDVDGGNTAGGGGPTLPSPSRHSAPTCALACEDVSVLDRRTQNHRDRQIP